MENPGSKTLVYCGAKIRVVYAGDRTIGYCPFCEHLADVETGFFPKFFGQARRKVDPSPLGDVPPCFAGLN
jgi:hypothetical protein